MQFSKSKQPFTFLCFSLLILIIIAGCHYSKTVVNNPDFGINESTIYSNHKELTNFKSAELTGTSKITGSEDTASELELRLINYPNAPTDDSSVTRSCKGIARVLKHSLKNPNQFNNFTILFVIKEEGDIATKTTYKGHVFNASEL
jgi:hypothetical protein